MNTPMQFFYLWSFCPLPVRQYPRQANYLLCVCKRIYRLPHAYRVSSGVVYLAWERGAREWGGMSRQVSIVLDLELDDSSSAESRETDHVSLWTHDQYHT